MKLSIILPTYNEAGNIAKLIKAIYFQKNLECYQKEFIVIDDNSPDGTATAVKKLRLPIKLIVRKNERGLATAILAGLKKATGEYIVIMDTDFNHRPEDIARLIEPIFSQQADLVIGSRYVKGGGMHVTEANRFQFFLSKWGNFLVNRILLGLPVHESLSGFLALKRSVLNSLNLGEIFQGYGDYCIRLLLRAQKKGFCLAEVPVVYGKRRYGESKSKLVTMFINYLKTAIKLKLSSCPHDQANSDKH